MGPDQEAPQATLLDPRLRFPIHALPQERVVWSGVADRRAYRAALLSAVWAVAVFALLGLLVVHQGLDDDGPCRRAVSVAGKSSSYRDCTAAERAEQTASVRAVQRSTTNLALAVIAGVLVLQWIANGLRRRHLVYVVTNERVVVQDGHLGIRLDTIDLDHVVSITAQAGLIERWFGLKSIAVTVPGQRVSQWKQHALANALVLWGIDAQDPALSQLLNVWLPRQRA